MPSRRSVAGSDTVTRAKRGFVQVAGPEFDRGYAEGRALTLDEAVSVALASPPEARS